MLKVAAFPVFADKHLMEYAIFNLVMLSNT
jgi:hypothetical protein